MSTSDHNPLLAQNRLPAFSGITAEHVVPALEHLLAQARQEVAELTRQDGPHTWASLAEPMDTLDERLSRAWAPVGHLHAVADNPALRKAYNECLPKLSEYGTEVGQNETLFRGYEAIANGAEFDCLNVAQQRTVLNALRDFRLRGVDLSTEAKQRYKSISARLAELSSKFSENVLDATQAWTRHVTDEAELAGLPESVLNLARETARREGLEGWLLTLEAPSYVPVMSYAEDTALRKEMYQASTTRASDRGPNAGKWDNTDLMGEILRLRHEKAVLLGFENYAQYSLATKMARNAAEVLTFLKDLVAHAKPVAEAELADLKSYAATTFGEKRLHAWDIPYYSEKLRQHRYDITQEELRPYFPVSRVLQGLFAVSQRLFGLTIRRHDEVDAWNDEVHFYTISDADGELRGQFYLDLYARPHKRGGAWMDKCVVRKRLGSGYQTPVAFLTCNFTPPVGGQPALLTHDEVATLFHEFGHGLHHLLTLVEFPSVAGINGVEWDAVELPSQLMENWCWEREALQLMSGHWQTGEPLPDEMLNRLRAAKNFHAGLKMIRQLEFALFDFRLHLELDPDKGARVQEMLAKVRREIAVVHPPAFNRFAHTFSHIFGGGYAAGYYSYLWAEVLSSDAFSKFEQAGVFDAETGQQFMSAVLEQGGSRDAMDLFIQFRGREPRNEPLLRHSGIITTDEESIA